MIVATNSNQKMVHLSIAALQPSADFTAMKSTTLGHSLSSWPDTVVYRTRGSSIPDLGSTSQKSGNESDLFWETLSTR